MRVVFTGDRHWTDRQAVIKVMKELPKHATVIHGGAPGLDTIAGEVAKELGLTVEVFAADWSKGRAAGPIRNGEMLDSPADFVEAFHNDLPNSKGTKNCVAQAEKKSIPTEVHTT